MKILTKDHTGMLDLQTVGILLFVVAAVAGSFYYMLTRPRISNQTASKKKLTSSNQVTSNKDPLPESFHDADGKFTISYPAGWLINNSPNRSAAGVLNNTYLTSPSGGTTISVKFQQVFVSSDCIPDFYDKPFQTTNRCFSSEYLSAKPLPIPAYTQTGSTVQSTQWYLVHYHYKTITINATELYSSCLVIGQPALGKPVMGFVLDHPISHIVGSDGSDLGYLSACVDAGNLASDYNKPEVVTGEAILRSLRFD